jgi:hypothetical protein
VCPSQNKRIAPLSFFHGCPKTTIGLIAFIPEVDCDQMAMGLPAVTSAVFFIMANNFGKTWVSRRNVCCASATPSGIKREWYVKCEYHKRILSTTPSE